MNRINLKSTLEDAIISMCEGNPGALTVCQQLFNHDMTTGFIMLCHLDDMQIYGPNLWIAYKDICGEDVKKLAPKIMDRSIRKELQKLKYVELP